MCGIAGVVRTGRGAPPLEADSGQAMSGRLRHRGPDGADAWLSPDGRCLLAHTRLKVIDLVTGDQPMGSPDGRIQVVFNGEIYNFRALRSELEAAGHRFRTASDTEVLVHGWAAWGPAICERLDGMFAFAVWDEAAGRLFLARDRAGKKPLYWTRVGDRVAFASEIKALLALDWVPDEIDPRAFPFYLAYGYVPAPGTFYQGIRVLPPAHRMWVGAVGSGGMTAESAAGMSGSAAAGPPGGGWAWPPGEPMAPQAYWQLHWRSGPVAGPAPTEREAVEEVRALLGAAVERRLVADVPLGAFLSGGIDSTLIVGLMRERIEGTIRTFSLGFADDPTYDETAFARLAARRFGTEHTQFTVEAGSVELVDELVDAHDQPFGDSSAIPTHIVSGLTREHVTVALTGDGGDEMFAGYPRMAGMVVAERLPGWMAAVGDRVGRVLPHHPDFRHPTRRFSRFFRAAALSPEERMLRWIGFLPDLVPGILRPEHRGLVDRRELTASFRDAWSRGDAASPLSRALALNFETYLPEDLLVKADRCSMAHGLELRSPFLDTAVMEFAAALPDRFRIRGRELKWLLKRAFPDLLPPEISGRSKQGFGVPLPVWFRTHWRSMVEERLFGAEARLWDWLERPPVERIWSEHQAETSDHGHALWALLTLETWLRRR